MRFGSLFSGIGGFDLAFERAGMTPVWNCEIDPKASEVLKRHWPNVPNLGDVRNVGRGTEPVDVICGGFPCQDLSVAGKRAGLAGERSGLWFEFARVIDELEPRWAVIENVPGLLSSDKGRDFATIIRWLAERGYGVAWRIFDAQYAGVAQRRRRVFVVASITPRERPVGKENVQIGTRVSGLAAEILFEREGVSWNPPTRGEAGQDVAYSIRANPSHSGDKGDGGINTTLVTPTMRSNGDGHSGFVDAQALVAHPLRAQPNASHRADSDTYVAFGGGNTSGPIDVATSRNVKGDTRLDFDTETFVVWDAVQETSVAHKTKPQSELSYTLNDAGQMMVGARRLTPIECERLQGFPDDWTAGQADSTRYRQLGNAVAVPVVEWIGRRLYARGILRGAGEGK